ncbi:MAG: DUF1579 domain-containing protein [Calditrichaeota bacterium]|nr:MAG: DUF1579 domain-containing protein [Calditrichota bacterium]
MRKSTLILALVLISAIALHAQEMSDSLMQAKQMEFMQLQMPGPEHEKLSKLEGDWDMEIKFWMAPNTDPITITSSGTFKMILGGRFLEMRSSGKFMGQDMETLHVLGFDRRSGEYTSTGFDSQGTYSVSAEGKYDAEKDMIVMYGEDYDAYWDFTQQYNFEVNMIDDDSFTWAVVFLDERMAQGQDSFKMVEIAYNRKK